MVVILALTAEFIVVLLHQEVSSSALSHEDQKIMKKSYSDRLYIMALLALVVAIIGTYISSYGDLGWIKEWCIICLF